MTNASWAAAFGGCQVAWWHETHAHQRCEVNVGVSADQNSSVWRTVLCCGLFWCCRRRPPCQWLAFEKIRCSRGSVCDRRRCGPHRSVVRLRWSHSLAHRTASSPPPPFALRRLLHRYRSLSTACFLRFAPSSSHCSSLGAERSRCWRRSSHTYVSIGCSLRRTASGSRPLPREPCAQTCMHTWGAVARRVRMCAHAKPQRAEEPTVSAVLLGSPCRPVDTGAREQAAHSRPQLRADAGAAHCPESCCSGRVSGCPTASLAARRFEPRGVSCSLMCTRMLAISPLCSG